MCSPLLLNNVSHTDRARKADLGAQIAACNKGLTRLEEKFAPATDCEKMLSRLDRSFGLFRADDVGPFLAQVPPGKFSAEDYLRRRRRQAKSRSAIAATITFPAYLKMAAAGSSPSKAVTIDFTGSDPQVQGSINAVESPLLTLPASMLFRCLLAEDVPANYRPDAAKSRSVAPSGTNCQCGSARRLVAGGNVETIATHRLTSCCARWPKLLPDRIPAASSGTMNNLTIGGIDPRGNEPFAYYETIAGRYGRRAPPSQASSGSPYSHDKFAEHSGGGARIRVSFAGVTLFP